MIKAIIVHNISITNGLPYSTSIKVKNINAGMHAIKIKVIFIKKKSRLTLYGGLISLSVMPLMQ